MIKQYEKNPAQWRQIYVRTERFRGGSRPSEKRNPQHPAVDFCNLLRHDGAEVYLKYENQQKTGSFKVRGAYNKIMKRYAEGDLHAVVASSAGNHAQGVAFAASSVGVKSTIVMPRSTPIAKVSATQGYGADVVLAGNIYDEAYAKACEICEETGAEFIHPFDDEDVMAGQGTIALEILRDLPLST